MKRSALVRSATLAVSLVLALGAGAQAQQIEPRGWLGVLLAEAPVATGDTDTATPPGGVLISRIVKDGPASRAGLRAGDIVRFVDARPVESVSDLVSTVGGLEPGTWVSFTVDRRGRERDVRVRLIARPENTSNLELREGWVGAGAIDLPASLQQHFGAPERSGVMVSEVVEGSPAHAAGLELGDVVFSVNGVEIRSARHFQSEVRGGGVGNPLEIVLMRSGLEIVLEAIVEEEPAEDEASDETS
jgi:serine protease Do